MAHNYTKKYSLSEIQIQLGALYFHLINLATLPMKYHHNQNKNHIPSPPNFLTLLYKSSFSHPYSFPYQGNHISAFSCYKLIAFSTSLFKWHHTACTLFCLATDTKHNYFEITHIPIVYPFVLIHSILLYEYAALSVFIFPVRDCGGVFSLGLLQIKLL